MAPLQPDPSETHAVIPCRGMDGRCPNTLLCDPGLAREVEDVVARSGWPEFLAERLKGPPRPHHRFRIALAGCANSCSQPRIMDFSLVRACAPRPPLACEACGVCATACPDQALEMPGGDAPPLLHASRCLACGLCIRACPGGEMAVAAEGFRVLVGGKLGRRPCLAAELPGLYEREEALEVLRVLLEAWMAAWRPGLRLGDVANEIIPGLPRAGPR